MSREGLSEVVTLTRINVEGGKEVGQPMRLEKGLGQDRGGC